MKRFGAIAALLAERRPELAPEIVARLAAYGALLDRREHGQLVADPRPEVVVGRHLVDALAVADAGVLPTEGAALDLGSGAGLPGLVLAVAGPQGLSWTLLEPMARRRAFLVAATAAARVELAVSGERAEIAGRGPRRGRHMLVTARAVAALDVLVELSVPLLAVGGRLVAWKGGRDAEEAAAGQRAAAALAATEPVWIRLPDGDEGQPRHVVVVERSGPLPDRYPRRDGVPARRPLGLGTTRPGST